MRTGKLSLDKEDLFGIEIILSLLLSVRDVSIVLCGHVQFPGLKDVVLAGKLVLLAVDAGAVGLRAEQVAFHLNVIVI